MDECSPCLKSPDRFPFKTPRSSSQLIWNRRDDWTVTTEPPHQATIRTRCVLPPHAVPVQKAAATVSTDQHRSCSFFHTHHGRHDPADVDGVVPVHVVQPCVGLVLRADLQHVHTGLQNTRLILYRYRKTSVTLSFHLKVFVLHILGGLKYSFHTRSKDHGLDTRVIGVPINSSPESLWTYSSLWSSKGMYTASSATREAEV